MTTIAYRSGRLASDTQVNGGDDSEVFEGRSFKGGKTEDGHLWAMCGDAFDLADMRAWMEDGRGKGEDTPVWPQATLIMVTPEGEVRECEAGRWLVTQAEYFAWGSGQKFALGAMAVGASADEAVEAACRHDPWSSEPMLVEVLGETPEVAEPIAEAELVGPQPAETWKEQLGL